MNYDQNVWYFDKNVGDFEQNVLESTDVFAILRKMCDILSRMFGVLGKSSWDRASCSKFWAKYWWF